MKSKKPNRNPGRVVGPYRLDPRQISEGKPSYDKDGESLLENAPTDANIAYQLLAYIGDKLISGEPLAPVLGQFLGHALKQPIEQKLNSATDKECVKALTDLLHLTPGNRRPDYSFRQIGNAIHQELEKQKQDNEETSINQAIQIVAERHKIAKSTAHEYYNQCKKASEEQIAVLKNFNASYCNQRETGKPPPFPDDKP